MSTKIYNGLINHEVNTIKQLSKLNEKIRSIQQETIKNNILKDFNNFFANYVFSLIKNKGHVNDHEVFNHIRFQEKAFPRIREKLSYGEEFEQEGVKKAILDYLGSGKIQKEFENIKSGRYTPINDAFLKLYELDITEDSYSMDMLVLYLAVFKNYTNFKRYYDNFYADNDSSNNVYLFPLSNGKLLGYAVNYELYKNIIDSGLMEDYHYQNSTDKPDDVSETEWDIREQDWNKAIRHNITEGLAIEPDNLSVMVHYVRLDKDNISHIFENFKNKVRDYTYFDENDCKSFFENQYVKVINHNNIFSILRKFNNFYNEVIPQESKDYIASIIDEGVIDKFK